MKIIWLDRDGFVEKTEHLSPKQAGAKVGPLLGVKAGVLATAAPMLRPSRYCASVNMEEGTLTVYARGGSWCRDHKQECHGSGCS